MSPSTPIRLVALDLDGTLLDSQSQISPAEALTDSEFAAIYKEAQKYVGTPYVWGGSTTETGNALGLLHTAVAHDLIVEALLDARRSNYKNVGFLAAPAVHGLALLDQALHASANAGGVCVEALFHIVGAQHDDEQVDDFMALEQGIGHAQSIHGLVDGVYKNGGAAGRRSP